MVEKKDSENIYEKNPFNLELKYAEDYITLSEKFCWQGEVMEGISVIKKLEELILDGEIEFKIKEEGKSDYETFQENHVVKYQLQDEELIFKCFDTYKHISKRDPDRSENGIDNWFKYEENINSITICGRSVMTTKLINIVAMFKEMDLLASKVEQFEYIKPIHEIHFSRWIAQCAIKMPVTFTNRDMVLVGVSLFEKREKAFIIAFKSTNKDEYSQVPDPDDKHCRMNTNYGFYISKYIDPEHVELFFAFNVDPKITVPWFLLNSFIKQSGYYIMSDLKKIIETDTFEKLFAERLIKSKEDYDIIRKAIGIDL